MPKNEDIRYFKDLKDDRDLTGLTPKQIEKRKRLIAWMQKHGSPDIGGTRTRDKA